MTRIQMLIVAVCLALGVGGYLVIGRPGMADQPMAERQHEIVEKIRTAPETLTAAETLARLEQTAVDQPDAPEPHYFIGEVLRAQNRPEDAARAYQSALRRDATYVPALVGLAQVLVEMGDGAVGPDAARLFARAYELDDTQVQAGMWAAMGAAQAGDQEKAAQMMRAVFAKLPPDDPRRDRFGAMLDVIGEGEALPEE
ncbi:tetratricopeptide repeat protein [Hyphomonas sp.]|uniref:tetratricopeptide repeat protein n=1 Tax=Hyphomonas sp. TaxID=87 RepID=UPI0030F531D1